MEETKNGDCGVENKSDIDDEVLKRLLGISLSAKSFAYCPYSQFPVGAALLTEGGEIFSGCNVENAVYPLGICAEMTAVVKAVSAGHRKFRAVVVCSNSENIIPPCGPCRQVLAEFNMDCDVYMTEAKSDKVLKASVRQLLPYAFEPTLLIDFQDTLRLNKSVDQVSQAKAAADVANDFNGHDVQK